MMDEPKGDELVAVVAAFMRDTVLPGLSGQVAFDARVAANALDLACREMRLGPAAERAETARLAALLGREGSRDDLNRDLCARIRDGSLALAAPGLSDHLRETTLAKLAIDQPTYATFKQVQAEGWHSTADEPWPDQPDTQDRTP
jgi:hypothetical protein